jgi:hypothetical protein
MLLAYCLEVAKPLFNMCSTKGFNIPCVELKCTKPSLEHNEELATMDTKVLIEAMGDYLHAKSKIPKGANNN